jgi:hypothetical protein
MDKKMTDKIDGWHVYSYCFLDDLTFIRQPAKVFKDWQKNLPFVGTDNLDETIEAVRQRFLREGWEGDGEIGIIWIPPFIDISSDGNFGTYIWHVKQQNNGISWLLSPEKLDFKRIERQNPWDERLAKKGWIPENIIKTDVETFMLALLGIKQRLIKQMSFISRGTDTEIEKEINSDLLKHHQGQVVANFYTFLDWCYLNLLQEVILEGNRYNIKLQKSSVKLSLINYRPIDTLDLESSPFFTLSGLVVDIWNAFKFEPINSKFDMLFKSVDFPLVNNLKRQVLKHIEIRNCIQHHNGKLMPESLKHLGVKSLSIKTSNPKKPIIINESEEIILTESEIVEICDSLLTLSQDFSEHIDVRIPSKVYSKPTKL